MRNKVNWIVLLVAGCISVCGLGGLLVWWSLNHGSSSLDAGIVAYRKAGLPWTAHELQPPLPPNEDAGPLLNKGVALFGATDIEGAERDIRNLLANGKLEGAAAQLDKFKRELDVLEQASQRPHAVIETEWDAGVDARFPEYGQVRWVARMFDDRAYLEAKLGNVASSDHDLEVGWKLGRLCGEQPLMIGLLVEVAATAGTFRTVEYCANAYSGDAAKLAQLRSTANRMGADPDFERGTLGEAYRGLATLRNLDLLSSRLKADIGDDSPLPPPIDPKKLRREGKPEGLRASLEGGAVLQDYADLENIVRADRGNPIRMNADTAAFDERFRHAGLRTVLAEEIMSDYSVPSQVTGQVCAVRLTTKALIALLEFHAKNRRWPKSISEVPGTWIDPYDGKPLRLKFSGESFKVYSIGPDLVDDGGLPQGAKGASIHHYDIVAMYPRVLPKPAPTAKK